MYDTNICEKSVKFYSTSPVREAKNKPEQHSS